MRERKTLMIQQRPGAEAPNQTTILPIRPSQPKWEGFVEIVGFQKFPTLKVVKS